MAGVNSISEASVASNIIHTGNQYHYSGKYFYDTVMIDGYGYKWNENIKTSTNQPNKEGTSIQIGNTGNGYAKIELISIGVDIGPEKSEYINSYSFQDKAQEFKTPVTGTYKVELWGASGSSKGYTTGGKGAYTSGEIYLKKDELFYIYEGETGEVFGRNAYNGGGSGTVGYKSGSGGGATDIRLVSGIWSSYDSLKTRIMVAAGGGGAGYWSGATAGGSGGSAGGLLGYSGSFNYASSNDGYLSVARGGSQTIGGYGYRFQHTGGNGNNGSFGRGANGDVNYGGGGGGGYYGGGGGAASNSITGQGGGGSSYISGHKGCNSILEESTSTNIIHNGSPYHYSGYFFENTNMVDGNGYKWESDLRTVQTNMPSYNSDTLVVGNTGNGYARITLINTEKKVSGEAEYTNYSYSFSNSYQIFDVLNSGNYKIELWGASGGDYSVTGGSGAYTSGEINLLKGTRLFVFVGQSGMAETITTFNGGGDGRANRSDNKLTSIGMSGGGATDIRTKHTSSLNTWNEEESLKSRIMVAAGGGGGSYYSGTSIALGGAAGGLIGYNGTISSATNSAWTKNYGTGGTQLKGGYNYANSSLYNGMFGLGSSSSTGGSGGSGWYGGGGGLERAGGSGGGGSSYISGHAGCIAVDSNGNSVVNTYSELSDSISFTGLQFFNTSMIDGKGYQWTIQKNSLVLMPTHDGTTTMTGNTGDGYAKITYLG